MIARRIPSIAGNRLLTLWRAGLMVAALPARNSRPSEIRALEFPTLLARQVAWRRLHFPYLFREHYEPELMLLERFLQPGMVFVDGGANTGVFTFVAAGWLDRRARCFSFEPGAVLFSSFAAITAIKSV